MRKTVKNIKHIRLIYHPFDYAFTLMFEEYPEEYVKALKAPGKFIKKANTQVKLPNGKTGEMDAPYVAAPDGKTLFEMALVLLEHQRTPVDPQKNLMISNYVIQGVSDEKLPFLVAIASHIEKRKHQQEFERTASFLVRLQFLDLGERDNWERLYNIRNKLRFDKNLSVEDGLNLGIVVLFAPEDCAKERTREALHYLLESEITSKRLEYVMYSVFSCMIDAYFEEENEYRRMKRMLDEKASPQTKEKFASEIRLENRLNRVSAEIDELTAEKDKITAERDKMIAEMDEIILERDNLNTENTQAYALINLLLSELLNDDEDLKEKMRPFENILKKCNV